MVFDLHWSYGFIHLKRKLVKQFKSGSSFQTPLADIVESQQKKEKGKENDSTPTTIDGPTDIEPELLLTENQV